MIQEAQTARHQTPIYYIRIYMYTYIAEAQIDSDQWPRFTRLCSPLGNDVCQVQEYRQPHEPVNRPH